MKNYDDDFDEKMTSGLMEARRRYAEWLDQSRDEFFEEASKRCGLIKSQDGSKDKEIKMQGVENYDIDFW